MPISTCTVTGNVKSLLGSNVQDCTVRVSVTKPFFHGETLISGEVGSVTSNASGDFSIGVVETESVGQSVTFTFEYYDGLANRKLYKVTAVIPDEDTAPLSELVAVATGNSMAEVPADRVSVEAITGLTAVEAQAAFAEHQADITSLQSTTSSLGTDLDAAEADITTLQADVITAQGAADAAQDDIDAHVADVANPHSVTPAQVGNGTAQWNANKIQGVEVDDAAIADGFVLVYKSGTGKLEYESAAGSSVSDAAYGVDWDGVTSVAPSKNAAYDKIEAVVSDVDAIDTRLTAAEGDIDTLEAADTALDTRLDTAESDIDALELADTALDGRLDTAEADIAALEAADTALDGRLDDVEADVALAATSADLSAHEAATTSVHGIADTAELATKTGAETLTNKTISVASNTVGGLTINRAVISDGSGNLAVSSTTSNQLSFLNSATSNVQTQLDAKASTAALDAHTGDAAGAHAATAISFTPAGTIAATDAQAAIEEVASEAASALTAKFDTSTGHDHDGTDSKKVLATNLDPTGASSGQVVKYNGTNVEWAAGGSETVAARYTNTAGTTFTAATEADFVAVTQDYDSHSAFSSPTFTVPTGMGGRYRVTAQLRGGAVAQSGGSFNYMSIHKNGSFFSFLAQTDTHATATYRINLAGSDEIDVADGDTLKVRVRMAVTNSLDSTAGTNRVSFSRIGD